MTERAAAAWIGSLLLGFVTLFAGCRAASQPAPSARGVSARPSILLVTLDTTRAGPPPRRPRGARDRPPPARRPPAAGGAAPPGRLPNRGVRVQLRAGSTLRPRAGLRPVRRRAPRRAGRAHGPGDHRPGPPLSGTACFAAIAALGPLLRPAPPLPPARAVSKPLLDEPVPRRGRGDGRGARAPGAGLRGARPRTRRDRRGE